MNKPDFQKGMLVKYTDESERKIYENVLTIFYKWGVVCFPLHNGFFYRSSFSDFYKSLLPFKKNKL